MNDRLLVTGMVLSAMPVGDYDKRLILLTKELGRITAFARGARRTNSPLLAASNPFCFGSFEVYRGRDAYTVSRAEISNYFSELTSDFDRVCLSSYFLEIAEYFSVEGPDEAERLLLLYQSLRAIECGRYEPHLVRVIYELKTMAVNGEYPNVFSCSVCGKEEELTYISIPRAGCLCKNCSMLHGGSPLHPSALYTMQFIITTPPAKLFSFALSPEVLSELTGIMVSLRNRLWDHTFKSAAFIDS